jgi:hypothetical protein
MGEMDPEAADEAAGEAARTVPPREHGGNHDIKDLSIGTTVYFPVYVEGGKFGVGDFHASQGDGEITFCGAIEMAGFVDCKFEVVKNGMEEHGVTHPIFEPGHRGPNFEDYVTFCGYSVTEDGEQQYMNSHTSYRRACLQAIDYLKKFGYTGQQALHILGTVPIEGRHSGMVDVPNSCSTLALPTGAFEFDLSPGNLGNAEARGALLVTDDPLGCRPRQSASSRPSIASWMAAVSARMSSVSDPVSWYLAAPRSASRTTSFVFRIDSPARSFRSSLISLNTSRVSFESVTETRTACGVSSWSRLAPRVTSASWSSIRGGSRGTV